MRIWRTYIGILGPPLILLATAMLQVGLVLIFGTGAAGGPAFIVGWSGIALAIWSATW